MQKWVALLTGMVFGVGLMLGEMVNPKKIHDFLDLFGQWDYSLALVMAAALGVSFLAFTFSRRRSASLLGNAWPTFPQSIDWRLILGAILFGVGWGLGGMCPAPALLVAGMGLWQGVVFCVAMLAGMAVFHLWQNRRSCH